MRWIACCVALALLVQPGSEELLEVRRSEGLELTYMAESSMALDLDEISVRMNGMELPPEAVEEMGMGSFEMAERSRGHHVDRVLAASEGEATRVRRSFELLWQSERGEEGEVERTGVLEGEALILSLADGEVEVELEGETSVEERFLTGHRIEHPCESLLPTGEVAVGASWSPSEEDLRVFLGLGSELELFDEDEDEDEAADFQEMMDEHVRLDGDVRFEAIEERDGLRCALLAFTIDMTCALDELPQDFFGSEEGPELSGTLTLDGEVEGKLWFALTERHPVAVEQAFSGEVTIQVEARFSEEELEFLMEIEVKLAMETEDRLEVGKP